MLREIHHLPPDQTDVLVFFAARLTGRGQADWASRQPGKHDQPGKPGPHRTVVHPDGPVTTAYGLFLAYDPRTGVIGNWHLRTPAWPRKPLGPVYPPPPGSPGHDPAPPVQEPEVRAEQLRADLTWVRSRAQANHDDTRTVIGNLPDIGRPVIVVSDIGAQYRRAELLRLIAAKSWTGPARVVLLWSPTPAERRWLRGEAAESGIDFIVANG